MSTTDGVSRDLRQQQDVAVRGERKPHPPALAVVVEEALEVVAAARLSPIARHLTQNVRKRFESAIVGFALVEAIPQRRLDVAMQVEFLGEAAKVLVPPFA